MSHKNKLRTYRKKWALSQRQLAALLGLKARSVISSYEFGKITPGLHVAIAYEFVFGEPVKDLFPGLAEHAENLIILRAAALDQEIGNRDDATAKRVRQFLQQLVRRARPTEA